MYTCSTVTIYKMVNWGLLKMETISCLIIGNTSNSEITLYQNFVRNDKFLLKLNNFLYSCQLIY